MKHKTADPTSHQSFWLWVMCLSGVDYFSSLGYQPSIAFDAAGKLAPLATVILVLVTLLAALPVYAFVARRSPYGQGSIYMLEQLLTGWTGKFLVLFLLGFAATDFVLTKTLSAADAARHLIVNPIWPVPLDLVGQRTQLIALTMFLLVLLGATFLRGFREVIGVAAVIVGIYLTLAALIIGSGLVYLAGHPEKLVQWWQDVAAGNWYIQEAVPLAGRGPWATVAVVVLIFPKLALGLSGFETGVAVMPLIRSGDPADPAALPGRIRNARKLLVTAAGLMSVYLLGSSLVVSTLIEPAALSGAGAPARDRALAYLAHGQAPLSLNPLFGSTFGTVFDLSTFLILWFAGASAMAGLLNLVPLYLPRYGMAPRWFRRIPPLVLLFTAINLFVTWVFQASVTAQGGAYATGVLVLITSACVAAVIECWKARPGPWYRRVAWYYAAIALVFLYTTADVVVSKPEGIKIAGIFIAVLVTSSMVTRFLRSTELRFEHFEFADDQSRAQWEALQALGFHVLVPHRPGGHDRLSKIKSIRADHRLGDDVPIVFVEAELEDASNFFQKPMLEVTTFGESHLIRLTRCASIAQALAAVSLQVRKSGAKPPELHFGWDEESSLKAMIGFLLFGEGKIPLLVHDLVRKAEPNPERRPRVIVG